jgi:ATP-dependent helicase HrpB
VELIDAPGRVFPVEIRYHPLPERGPLGRETSAALERLLPGGTGDTLVFLPGKREIEDARLGLRGGPLGGRCGVYPLHGSLPLSRQREIIAPGPSSGPRRIILSTNLAETSLTIPGVTLVVDSGYVRLERYYLPADMNRLSLEPHSLQSAEQRAGRAGRLGPGRCVRLWKEGQARSAETESEIRRVDLAGLVLECLLWGARERPDLPWLEPPPEGAWNRALEQLRDLGALEGEGTVTPRGRELALLGIEPRLGVLCLAGRDRGLPVLACAAAALLSEGDPSGIRGDADFRRRLERLRKRPEEPWTGRVMKNAGELLARLGGRALPSRGPGEWSSGEEENLGELLAAAFPGRVALLQGSGKYRFPSGREAAAEGLSGVEWIVAAEVDAGERSGFIRLAAPLPAEKALEILEKRSLTERRIEWEGLVPRLVLTRAAGRLTLSREQGIPRRDEVVRDLPRLLGEGGIGLLPWDEEGGRARRFLDRVRFFRARRPGGAEGGKAPPDWTDEALAGEAAEWLGPFIWEGRERAKGPVIRGGELLGALEARLGWEAKRELDALAPEYFILPNGKKRPVDYSGGEPSVRVRLQDCFGIREVVRILSVPLVFHLLSPAERPIQVTGDLPGFWAGSYRELRKEMRGRYPKHRWPENPLEQE